MKLFFIGTASELRDLERAHKGVLKCSLICSTMNLDGVGPDAIIILGGTSGRLVESMVDELSMLTQLGALIVNVSGWDNSQHGWLCGLGAKSENYDTEADEENCETIANNAALGDTNAGQHHAPAKRGLRRALHKRAAYSKRKKQNSAGA